MCIKCKPRQFNCKRSQIGIQTNQKSIIQCQKIEYMWKTVLKSKGKKGLKNDLQLMKVLMKEKGTTHGKMVKEVIVGVKAAQNKHSFITKPLTWNRLS